MTGELLIIPSIDCGRDGEALILDKKFVSGMELYRKHWRGPVRCVLRQQPHYAAAYSAAFRPADLGFTVTTLADTGTIADDQLCGSAVVLGSGDDPRQAGLAQRCRRLGIACVLGVEYTVGARLDIVAAERRSRFARLKSAAWTLGDEVRRRRSFSAASGLQANGAAAFAAYGDTARGDLLYFDNRLAAAAFADNAAIARSAAHRRTGAPLRLLFSGRLEPMKGADHLVPVMRELRRRGSTATLDIFGDGSLAGEMRAAIAENGLVDSVVLHGPVDFETVLLPRITGAYDVFLCCHPQSDPSCTYVETLGCGIPIAGYRNGAFAGILGRADIGWGVPIGKTSHLAAVLQHLDNDRDAITAKAMAGRDFARNHSFEAEFARRIDHLHRLVDVTKAGTA
jgi:colanic acid/amylovoran biosynthesis glycosyltransferase